MRVFTILIIVFITVLVQADDKLVDDRLTTNAVAVLRVDKFYTQTLHDSPFVGYYVHVRQVLKNDSNEDLRHDFMICAFKDKSGVPSRTCTVYLERYDSDKKLFNKIDGFWILVGGDATNGVSNVDNHSR
jgi:hypothetical protein